MCGIICIYKTLNLNLIKNIKHRGQESYGFGYPYNNEFVIKNFNGKLPDRIPSIYSNDIDIKSINYVLGHTRYSTSGQKLIQTQSQPIKGKTKINNIEQEFILVHNGNISGRKSLKRLFNCTIDPEDTKYTDSQILVEIINSMNKKCWKDILQELLSKIPGTYNLLIGIKNGVIIVRDRFGVRPLTICKEKDNDTNYCVLSETDQIQNFNYEFVRNVRPGEVSLLTDKGITELKLDQVKKLDKVSFMPCTFEYIYFASKYSNIDDVNIFQFRYKCGQRLAFYDRDFYFCKNRKNIIVVGAPETGVTSGMAYADELNLNYHQILSKKNKGRTFILDKNNREKEVKIKYEIKENYVRNKEIVIVDDSLVRGNTIKVLIQQLQKAGASSVHVRIASPPVISPCYFGIDMSTYEELIANNLDSVNHINTYIGSTTLKYLKVEDIISLLPPKSKNACVSCFTNSYEKKLLEW